MSGDYSRRLFIKRVGSLAAGGSILGLAGCISDPDVTKTGSTPEGNTVLAGPNQELVFEPEEITVSVGDSVTWSFESPGHNVSAYPDHHDSISIPDQAEPFGTEGVADDKFATVPEGETFEHTFDVAGEYDYACIPHVSSGMQGTVVVEE